MATIAELGVEVRTRGAKESTRELQQLNKAAKASEATAAKLGKAWGVALGAGAAAVIVGGVSAIVKATLASEKSQAKLEARVKALGPASAKSAAQVSMLAESLQGLSTFDDEKIKDAATSLLAFNNIKGDNFDRTMRAAVDLAADRGSDLEAIAEKLGKALNNPATASRQLRDIGIELSKQQKELVKDLLATGKGSEAQGVLLAELERRYKGAALAARNTLGGALQGLKNDFDNLLEGDSGGIKGVTESINDLSELMRSSEVKDGFQTIVGGLFNAANAAVQATAKIGLFVGQYQKFLSSKGFARADSSTSMEDLQTRLGKLQEQSKTAFTRTFANEAIQAEIAQVQSLIRAFPFRGVASNVDSTAFGGSLDGRDLDTGGGGKGRSKRIKELPDFAKDASEELQKLIEQEKAATSAYLDLSAILGGPLAEAQREHIKNVEEINALAEKSPEANAGRAALLTAEADRYARETEEIKKQLNPFGELIDQRRFELSLIGKSAAEVQTLIDLRNGEGKATAAEAEEMRALNEQYEIAQENMAFFEDVKHGLADTFTDFVTGAKSAKDAFGDFADMIFQRSVQLLADKAVNALFGEFTGGAGGSSAGGFADLFSSGASGFGFASGGYTGNAGVSDVAGVVHGKEYVLNAAATRRVGVGNLDRVNSGGSMGGSVVNQSVTFMVEGRIDRSTQSQVAQRAYSATNMANRRNG